MRTLVPDEVRAWAGVQRGGNVPPHPSQVAALHGRSSGLLLSGCVPRPLQASPPAKPQDSCLILAGRSLFTTLAALTQRCLLLRRFSSSSRQRNVILARPRQGQASLRSVRQRTLDMAFLRPDWGSAGRRKKNTNAAATGRSAARVVEHNV